MSRELAWFASGLLRQERERRGTPHGSRKLTCYWQAVPGLRWFRDKTDITALARDHGVSRATGYQYVDEVIEVLAARAPELPGALARAMAEGVAFVILDGKVIPADRCRERTESVKGQVRLADLFRDRLAIGLQSCDVRLDGFHGAPDTTRPCCRARSSQAAPGR